MAIKDILDQVMTAKQDHEAETATALAEVSAKVKAVHDALQAAYVQLEATHHELQAAIDKLAAIPPA